jgi:hypothetical protein
MDDVIRARRGQVLDRVDAPGDTARPDAGTSSHLDVVGAVAHQQDLAWGNTELVQRDLHEVGKRLRALRALVADDRLEESSDAAPPEDGLGHVGRLAGDDRQIEPGRATGP